MKLLDTNVVVYAIGWPHAYQQHCANLLRDLAQGSVDYNVDVELLREILYLYTRRGQRTLGLSTCADLEVMFPDPFPITAEVVRQARTLMEGFSRLLPRDAIHAAVVLANQLEGIVSTDNDFDQIAFLKRFDPLSLAD